MDEEELNKLNDLNKNIIEEVTSKISGDAVVEKVADQDTIMEEVTAKISCDCARRNRKCSKQPFTLEESHIDTMADQCTMIELLRAPTEGYAEAIVVPLILAEQFELKHSLINMMTSDQFFRLEKDNPHDHIRWFNKITSTIKYKDMPNAATKLMLFPFSLAGAARRWLEKEPPRSIHTWEDLVSEFINEFFPPQEQQISNMMVSLFQINAASTSGLGSLPSNTVANRKGELKSITTRSGLVLDGPIVPTPPPFINLREDERVEETLTDHDLSEYTIKVPSPPLHINITLTDALILMPKYQKILKALLSNKEKLHELANTPLNENCSAVILKKLLEKLGDPGKFLIKCGFNELKCKALADLGDSINLMPLSVWKKLGPFLRTARALIDVHGEEMILRNGDERLTLNMRHDTSSYSNQPQKESINLINVFNNSSKYFLEDLFSTNHPSGNPTFSSHPELTSSEVKNDIFDPEGGNVLPEKLLDLDSTKNLHPPLHVNPLSGSITYFSSLNQLLEEFINELTLVAFPLNYDDDLQFDIESDLKEIEYLFQHDPIKNIDSSLKDLIDQSNLANLDNNLVDSMAEMFPDEQALDYSYPLIFDIYDDDLFEVEFDTENVYDDPFDSKGEKIKESKFLIDGLDLPCDFLLSECDLILSEEFSRVDVLPSTNNEDKVFKPCILIQENPFEIITHVVQDKKLAISNASLMLEDVDPPLYELPFFKEVPRSKMLLLFSCENEENVFKPVTHTSKKLILLLSQNYLIKAIKFSKLTEFLKA
nr:reverse transcriptase domain-containing protein [Tanacetum cinerariifolium]